VLCLVTKDVAGFGHRAPCTASCALIAPEPTAGAACRHLDLVRCGPISTVLLLLLLPYRYADPAVHRAYMQLLAARPDLSKACNGVILYGLCKCDKSTGLAAVKRLSELPEAWTSAARVNASAFLYQKVRWTKMGCAVLVRVQGCFWGGVEAQHVHRIPGWRCGLGRGRGGGLGAGG
jgi:hypothetical protein